MEEHYEDFDENYPLTPPPYLDFSIEFSATFWRIFIAIALVLIALWI